VSNPGCWNEVSTEQYILLLQMLWIVEQRVLHKHSDLASDRAHRNRSCGRSQCPIVGNKMPMLPKKSLAMYKRKNHDETLKYMI